MNTKDIEETKHSLNREIAGLAGLLNGSLIHDSGQAHIANMKLDKILEYIDALTQHHQAEVGRAVEAERERIISEAFKEAVPEYLLGNSNVELLVLSVDTLRRIVTPTKTDNQ